MKKYRFKYIQFLLLGILFAGATSCDKRLDLQPVQSISTEVALSTSSGIEGLLVGAYNRASRNDLYGGRIQMLADLYGFHQWTGMRQATFNGTFQQPMEVFNKSVLVNNSFVASHWLEAYSLINATNLILDHIDVVDEDVRDEVSGSAKFLRALVYFDLVRMFATPYETGQANSQPGVPISVEGILDYSGDLRIPRNTVEEVYDQIISDLNAAYNELPSANSFWSDQYSAKALLARVYLQQGNYTEARDAAHEVIGNSGRSLTSTYAGAFNNDANSSEDLFAIQFTSQDASSSVNQLIAHYASQPNGGRGGDIRIQQDFIDMFDSPTDVRGSFFDPLFPSGRNLSAKYTNEFANLPVIRLAEMYLIRAEANFREGTAIGASPLDDINTIRERADADLLSAVTLDAILLEREFELSFEGFLIHDIKRTKRDISVTVMVDHDNDPDTDPVPTLSIISYDAPRLVYPIPQREMDVNPLLEPNPGYTY